ncbi:MAG: PadR family transcriptional regulator [Streptosporangiaceae bacterium]
MRSQTPRAKTAKGPSPTNYVVLCLLALRDWTAYELAAQVRRSLRYCWPKTDRLLYFVPKRLAAEGLASVRREDRHDGRRARTTYAITPAGRRALRAWLATEPAPPELEFEAMVRLTFADQGTNPQALAAIDSIARHAEQRYREGLGQLREYLDDGGPFPERLHIIALTATFHADYLRLLLDWAARARAEVGTWPTTTGLGMTASARLMLQQTLARGERDLGQPTTQPPAGTSAGAGGGFTSLPAPATGPGTPSIS